MLVCISANPALDRRLRLENIALGEINRALSAQPFPGGKAAHVAMVAKSLGLDVMWVGFLGGAAGEQCESGLTEFGVPLTVIRTESEAGTQVALCGSLPPGAPSDLYAELIRLAHEYDCRTLLDTSGDALRQAIIAAPDFVKPNRREASDFAGYSITRATAAVEVMQKLFEAGAKSVAISLGADGIVWQRAASSDAFISEPLPLADCSPVGCGDAALAGFAVAHERGLGDEETLRLATACGSANCIADAPGRVNAPDVQRLTREVAVRRAVACESARHAALEAQ